MGIGWLTNPREYETKVIESININWDHINSLLKK